jgi:MFS family permease
MIEALWQFYVIMGTLLGIGSVLLGALPGSTLVANWFSTRRGIALGIAGMGISLSGFAMAPVATRLIESIGWRHTFLVYAAVTIASVIPAVWLVVVNRPEEMGLLPDGVRSPANSEPTRRPLVPPAKNALPSALPARPDFSTGSVLRDRNFWVIALFVALNFCANGAVLTHIIPHATDIGIEPMAAAWVLSTMAGLGVAGKLLFGWIVDRVPQRLALWLASGLQAIGVALVLSVDRYPALLIAGAVFGLGMGGIIPLWGAVIGSGFGRHAFGRVMGLMIPVMIPVQIVGIPYAGWIFDRNGTYDVAFTSFIAAYALAIAAVGFLRLPEVEPGAAPTLRASDAAAATSIAGDAI